MAETNQTALRVARTDEQAARRALALVDSAPAEAHRLLQELSGRVTDSAGQIWDEVWGHLGKD